ncbi:hypothetical protein BFP71_16825 [Roseivirga misakiensis]|uniref:DUF4252 domain-containing protein n=2 Tax=Roseivirga misakiensis TaxID=1563681 RepID=A0A1E5T147_9BACT|nr:hypothetical protein BFP71_16825 [Roseivirga misakiensis]
MTLSGFAQSRSVERFREDNRPSTKLFFYKSTLKMISRIDLAALGGASVNEFSDMPPIGDMIKGIEKVKFFLYENSDNRHAVGGAKFKALQTKVEEEGYESMMSARVEGMDMNVMMKERRGKPKGFVVLITMEQGFSIIDIEGYPDVNNILKFSQFMNSNGSSMGLKEAFR